MPTPLPSKTSTMSFDGRCSLSEKQGRTSCDGCQSIPSQRVKRVICAPEPLGGPTILIVDDDLGFVCWLGEIVTEAGYQAVPALDSLQAAALVNELNLQIDLVVMNPGLPGVSQMIET